MRRVMLSLGLLVLAGCDHSCRYKVQTSDGELFNVTATSQLEAQRIANEHVRLVDARIQAANCAGTQDELDSLRRELARKDAALEHANQLLRQGPPKPLFSRRMHP